MSPTSAATLTAVKATPAVAGPGSPASMLDPESREWLRALRSTGPTREEAIARLHALLLRAARFEVARRRPTMPHLRGDDLDDLANHAANDALVSVLARLDDFRGASRFTTGSTSSRSMRRPSSCEVAPGRDARSHSSQRRGACSRLAASNPSEEVELRELRRRCRTGSQRSSRRTSDVSSSRSRSTASRSTFSPNGWGQPAAPSTRRCTTRGGSCEAPDDGGLALDTWLEEAN